MSEDNSGGARGGNGGKKRPRRKASKRALEFMSHVSVGDSTGSEVSDAIMDMEHEQEQVGARESDKRGSSRRGRRARARGNVQESRSRGRRGRGSRGSRRGRGRVGRGGLQLDEDDVRRLIDFQNEAKRRVKVLVEQAPVTKLRRLVMMLTDRQPGLLFDLMEELEEEPDVDAPQAATPQQRQHTGPAATPPAVGTPPAAEPRTPPAEPRTPPDEPSTPQAEPRTPPAVATPAAVSPSPPGSPIAAARNPEQPPDQRQSPDWCTCGQCTEMPSPVEDVCCRHRPDQCISDALEMEALIMHRGILMIQRLYRADIFNLPRHNPIEERGRQRNVAEEHKRFRHAAYRQFVLWQHGRLGYRNRRVVPSCCVLKIRQRFPDPYGHYVGFRPAPLV